jgi:DNA helicase-2/ATP-dependent DNA helicase PcrA
VDGEVALLSFASDIAEARGIADLVEKIVNVERVEARDVLVLVRSDYHKQFSRPIRQALERAGIPVSDPHAAEELLAIASHRVAIAILRLLTKRDDSLAWATVFKLTPSVGDRLFEYIYQRARTTGSTFGAATLASVSDGFNGGPQPSSRTALSRVQEVVAWLDEHAGEADVTRDDWGQWISDTCGEDPLPPISTELADLLKSVDGISEASDLARYLSHLTPSAKDYALASGDGVRIMTMGGAKGLTAVATIAAAVEEGVIPRPGSDASEERRLLYVAMTRPTNSLYCTWARSRTGPTARAGRPRVGGLRAHSSLLQDGPVHSEDGPRYIARRWP